MSDLRPLTGLSPFRSSAINEPRSTKIDVHPREIFSQFAPRCQATIRTVTPVFFSALAHDEEKFFANRYEIPSWDKRDTETEVRRVLPGFY